MGKQCRAQYISPPMASTLSQRRIKTELVHTEQKLPPLLVNSDSLTVRSKNRLSQTSCTYPLICVSLSAKLLRQSDKISSLAYP